MKSLKLEYNYRLDDIKIKDAADFFEQNYDLECVDILNWPLQFPSKPDCRFKIARSTKSIFIHYNVTENNILAKFTTAHDPVWQDSCVEFFCQLPGQKHYFNFEFNCIGTCLATKRLSRTENIVPFRSEEMNIIKKFSTLGNEPFEERSGNFKWELTVEIPFSLLGICIDDFPSVLNANFYKCGDKTLIPHYLSWNPIYTENPDFHQPKCFGELKFE